MCQEWASRTRTYILDSQFRHFNIGTLILYKPAAVHVGGLTGLRHCANITSARQLDEVGSYFYSMDESTGTQDG